MGDLTWLDATETAALIRTGDVSPKEAVDAAIERIERVNPQLNAVIHDRFDAARTEAGGELDGPFAGVPMVVKDLGIKVHGHPYTEGNRALKEIGYTAPHDSYLARRFKRAGFVIVGSTNTPEMGTTITTEPLAYGPTRNPWSTAHSTGGSSGGSAAAVASAMVPVGHANDGGGSIRIPAANCGLVGLKPSRGRVSLGPDLGDSWRGSSIDGVVVRSVRDAAAILDVIAGYEPGDPYTAPPFARALSEEVGAEPGSLRIGVLDHPLMDGIDPEPETGAAARAVGELLASLGHRVDAAWPEALGDAEFTNAFTIQVASYTARDLDALEARLGRPLVEDDVEPGNFFFRELGASITAPQYLAGEAWLQAWSRRVVEWWHGDDAYDLLVTPVLNGPPPALGFLSDPEQGLSRVIGLMQYTAQLNVTGQPAISLPMAVSSQGLPIGVQLVAAAHREDLLVRVAAQLEAAQPWSARRPAVHA